MTMTKKQLKALRLRKEIVRKRNIKRNLPRSRRFTLHQAASFGNKRPYRLYYI